LIQRTVEERIVQGDTADGQSSQQSTSGSGTFTSSRHTPKWVSSGTSFPARLTSRSVERLHQPAEYFWA
jgi:hypothetical protein